MFDKNQESCPTAPAREIGFFKFLEDSSKMKKIVRGLQIPFKKPSWSVDAFFLSILHQCKASNQAGISSKNSTQTRSPNLYQNNLITLAQGATSLSLNYCYTVAKQLAGGSTVIFGGVDSVLRVASTRSALSRFKKELDDSSIQLINTSLIIQFTNLMNGAIFVPITLLQAYSFYSHKNLSRALTISQAWGSPKGTFVLQTLEEIMFYNAAICLMVGMFTLASTLFESRHAMSLLLNFSNYSAPRSS